MTTHTAPKIRGEGIIHYRIIHDKQKLFIEMVHNDQNGHYSPETVSVDDIESCLCDNLTSRVFRNVFVSKSNNNAGFLTAILLAEKLLVPVGSNAFHYAPTDRWDEWKLSMQPKSKKGVENANTK